MQRQQQHGPQLQLCLFTEEPETSLTAGRELMIDVRAVMTDLEKDKRLHKHGSASH